MLFRSLPLSRMRPPRPSRISSMGRPFALHCPLPDAVKIAQEIIDSGPLVIPAVKRIDVEALINRVSELERGAFKLEAENDELRNEAGHCVSKD